MCCFSRAVQHVANTQIFVRPISDGRQVIIYSMEISAREDLAMILPIPVAQPAREDAVQFVDLHGYPNIFAGIRRGFPVIPATTLGAPTRGSDNLGPAPLKVQNVGSFVASFVPTVKDFGRLDEQFRLPNGVWEKLGAYSKYGFAVFKLKKGSARIHPMAFTFPTAMPDRLFFPTVHIHDGEVHPKADFDHELYCQVPRAGLRSLLAWRESTLPASRLVNIQEAKNLLAPDSHVFQGIMRGELENKDVILRLG